MSKCKINVAWYAGENRAIQFGLVTAEEMVDYEFCIGRKVTILDNQILSNHTKGIITGFSLSRTHNLLAHVQWLDGAPPIRIRIEKLRTDRPRKVWVVVQRNETVRDDISFSTGIAYMRAQRGYGNHRYFTREAAEEAAHSLAQEHGHDVLVLESVLVCNVSGQTETM